MSSGETSLSMLLKDMGAKLLPGEYVYCSFDSNRYGDRKELEPLASYQEEEGLSLLISKQKADERGLTYS